MGVGNSRPAIIILTELTEFACVVAGFLSGGAAVEAECGILEESLHVIKQRERKLWWCPPPPGSKSEFHTIRLNLISMKTEILALSIPGEGRRIE